MTANNLSQFGHNAFFSATKKCPKTKRRWEVFKLFRANDRNSSAKRKTNSYDIFAECCCAAKCEQQNMNEKNAFFEAACRSLHSDVTAKARPPPRRMFYEGRSRSTAFPGLRPSTRARAPSDPNAVIFFTAP